VEDFLSEREQIEQVRGWVKENAPWAIAGLVVGVVFLVGYQQFQSWRGRQSLTANQKYVAELNALARHDRAGGQKLADELVASYKRTPYADFGQLALARFDVEDNKLADAEKLLAGVAQSAADPEMKIIAQLRLARVQRAEHKPDLALATLASVPEAAHGALFYEVRGDLLLDKGDKAGAVKAWKAAVEERDASEADRELLRLKIAANSVGTAEAPAAPVAGAKP
jgi:predicted negative regulator of RcsB-dependent stress response